MVIFYSISVLSFSPGILNPAAPGPWQPEGFNYRQNNMILAIYCQP
jgi:hypothetical protein